MNLKEFIANVLSDIDGGLRVASEKTDRGYIVETGNKGGVSFDIAVQASDSTSTKAGGQAKAGFIEVLGAGVNASIKDEKVKNETSRIQFKVYVPTQTKKEFAASAALEQQNKIENNNWEM